MFDFPNDPSEGQLFTPLGGPIYNFTKGAWNARQPTGASAPDDGVFATRSALVNSIATGYYLSPGKIYVAGGYMYIAIPGVTYISDLPGLAPWKDIHVEHFGAVADMRYSMPAFTQTFTFQKPGPVGEPTKYFIAPWMDAGTNQLAAFMAADDYAVNVARTGVFYAEGKVKGYGNEPNTIDPRSGYFIDGQFILQGIMQSRKDYRDIIWCKNTNVYHSNIWINSVKGGVKGLKLISQYAYTGVAKPFGHGCIGCGITVGTLGTPEGGPAIATDELLSPVNAKSDSDGTRVPFITDVEIDAQFCRAGHGVRTGFPGISQISNSSYLFFGVGGIEYCKWKLGIHEQTNRTSNGLGICHWNFISDNSQGGNPLTNYSAMIPVETYHCCNTTVEFSTDINMFDQPHGFQCGWEFASGGHVETGPISVFGCAAVSISPGDLINHYTNPAQKEKIGKAIKVGKISAIDVPISGDVMTPYANGSGANVYTRGFGTSKFDNDIYETTQNRSICRQLECDITYESMSLIRTGKNGFTPRWNGRAFYAQGVQGKLTVGALTTFGIGRGFEIEYCDGDQSLSYIDGDGCLLYEFSRGGRLFQTDTNRNVEGYVENIADGSYRPGNGPGTRAVSIGGGSYSTIVDNQGFAERVNTLTKTYIVPFGGADDDVYRGTPIKIGNQTVTATEFIQGRSQSSSGLIEATTVAITGATKSDPVVITAPFHGYNEHQWVVINNVEGMVQLNGKEGLVKWLSDDTFSLVGINSTSYSTYTTGGTATQKLPTVPIDSISLENRATIVCKREHNYYEGQFVGIFGVSGLSIPGSGTARAVTKISKSPAPATPPVYVKITVGVNDIMSFANGMEVVITGADAAHANCNGTQVVTGHDKANNCFQLKGIYTNTAGGDQTTGSMTAMPLKSGINGKQGKVKYVDETTFTINIDTLQSPALTPYRVDTGGVIEAFEGVGYLAHTPLTSPATQGQKVTVNEFCRLKQGSITSEGGESGVVLIGAGIDNCDMHGLRSADKYGARMVNGRLSLKGPLPDTVGVNPTVGDNFTIYGDGKSLFSMADGTVSDNPRVAFHIYMGKDTNSGSTGHADVRGCRVENIAKLMEGNKSKLRFCLSMTGNTDTQVNQLLSHPARSGIDEDNGIAGAKGYFVYGDDGKLDCWLRNAVYDPTTPVIPGDPQSIAGSFNWIFPAAFNGGGGTVSIFVEPVSNALGGQRHTHEVTTGSSVAARIKFTSANISGITKAAAAVFTTMGNHGLSNGDKIMVDSIGGMVEMNGKVGTVTLLTTTTFSLNVDSSAFSTYGSGGYVHKSVAFNAHAVGRWFPDLPLVPSITSITPASTAIGQTNITLTLNGTNFDPTVSQVWFGGNPVPTTFVSTIKLTAVVDTTVYAVAQNVACQVRIGDSPSVSNVIQYPLTL